MKLVYAARFYPCEEQECYTVSVPDLPGCVSQGGSLAEAIEMAIDAASGWVLDELEQGNPVPKASPFSTFVTAWMNTFAEKNHVNFSSVLQEALAKQLTIN